MGKKLVCIITGDVVESSSLPSKTWLPKLKKALGQWGKSPADWEIYRGDSFQLMIAPEDSFEAILYIRSFLKKETGLDARVALGVGEIEHKAKKITEGSGEAFILSGQCFENLKRDRLAIRTSNQEINEELNVAFGLASLTIDSWTAVAAEVFALALSQPNMRQADLAKKLKKSQSVISNSLQRSGYHAIKQLVARYKKLVAQL